MKTAFSQSWKSSTQPRKQRKYRFNAPLHVRGSFMHCHLSPSLRKKHGKRNAQLRKGDTVKILRGTYKKKSGKVERVNLRKGLAYITGVDLAKKDGTKIMIGIQASKLMIEDLILDDKRRLQAIQRKTKQKQTV